MFLKQESNVLNLQGGWEDDETVLEAASREAMEEAGVKGILRVSSLFPITDHSSKFLYIYIFRLECVSSYRKIH